nr:auxin-responsive protein SAUR64-like [Solanum lycopersicum]
MNMISAKKLIKMARKWQKFAAKQRKRSSFPRSNSNDLESCSTSSTIVSKGNFVVYKPDQKQFVVPLAYLQHEPMWISFICSRTKKPAITRKPIICGYTDSDMAGGVVSWLQKCVALSTTKGELIAVVEACKELLRMKRFLGELGCAQERMVTKRKTILLAEISDASATSPTVGDSAPTFYTFSSWHPKNILSQ